MASAPTKTEKASAKRAPRFARHDASVRKQELIDAAIRCLSKGGIAAFTIDQICREAGVSRGLINHHFDGKDALLAAAYESMTSYLDLSTRANLENARAAPEQRLNAIIDAGFKNDTDRATLRAWLALWGEVSASPKMQQMHRRRYAHYMRGLVAAMTELAEQRGRKINAEGMAMTLIALIDGLWIEWCLDTSVLSEAEAKNACYDLLEPHLGSIRPTS